MRNDFLPQVERIGIELELQNTILRDNLKADINRLGWNITRDASAESNALSFLGKPVYKVGNGLPNFPLEQVHYGGELVSPIYDPDTPEFSMAINKITSLIQTEGLYSPRASFHVHVNVGKNLSLHNLKSMIRWATRLESTFFRLGSFGQEHRGIINNYTYCRPITGQGPLIVETPRGYGQIFIAKDLLESDSVDTFWKRYGDVYYTMDKKYHAVRYHWFNLFSIWKYGTVEFRVANLTLNPYYIRAYINFCQAVTFNMLTTNYKQLQELDIRPVNTLYSPTDNDCREAIAFIIDNYPKGEKSLKDVILSLYDMSTFPPIKDGYLKTHLFDKEAYKYYFNDEHEYIPPLIPSSQVFGPTYLDDHKAEANKKELTNVPTEFNIKF